MSSSSLTPVKLLLLGYGNVAKAFLSLLFSRCEWLAQELGIDPFISGIGTRSQGFYLHPQGIAIATLIQAEHPFLAFKKAEKSYVVQDSTAFIQIGKTVDASFLLELTTLNPLNGEPARSHVRTALAQDLHVITANKGPVAYAQAELQALARQQHVQFRFESTVMDGLPLINLEQFTLQAVDIRSFRALLNTTSSLVLSLIEQGYDLEEAIQEAQKLGIAEADPWYDLDGWDAVMKTTILANNLLAGQLLPTMVQRKGIRNLSLEAIRAAATSDTPLRLVSTGQRLQGQVIATVAPQHIQANDILRVGKGTTSILSLDTEAMGTITLVEHEPIVMQTAYGVLSDFITIIKRTHL